MAPGGKINRPKTALQKNLLKRRRLICREKRRKHMIIGAIVDKELITVGHLRKRSSSARANITLSGKKKRKLIKQLQHVQKKKEQMDVEPQAKPKKASLDMDIESSAPKKKSKKSKKPKRDVEMGDVTPETSTIDSTLV